MCVPNPSPLSPSVIPSFLPEIVLKPAESPLLICILCTPLHHSTPRRQSIFLHSTSTFALPKHSLGADQWTQKITTHHNETHPTNTTASAFTATWAYPQGPLDEPVHAFPNAKLELPQLVPVSLNNLSTLDIDVSWSYAVGDVVASSTDDAALVAAGMNANVCLDMFLDADPTNSASTNASAYEVMVWLGAYGLATQPIGLPNGSQQIVTINQTSLYVVRTPIIVVLQWRECCPFFFCRSSSAIHKVPAPNSPCTDK